jgi:hypothetical protein
MVRTYARRLIVVGGLVMALAIAAQAVVAAPPVKVGTLYWAEASGVNYAGGSLATIVGPLNLPVGKYEVTGIVSGTTSTGFPVLGCTIGTSGYTFAATQGGPVGASGKFTLPFEGVTTLTASTPVIMLCFANGTAVLSGSIEAVTLADSIPAAPVFPVP